MLAYNRLQYIPPALSLLGPSLTRLDLEGNALVGFGDVLHAPRLRYLNLAFNLLQTVPRSVVAGKGKPLPPVHLTFLTF